MISKLFLMASLLAPGLLFAQQNGEQRPGKMMRHDPVARLNWALESAGAPALDSSQEQRLRDLAESHQEARRKDFDAQAMRSGKNEMEKAILSGNEADVSAAADRLASEFSGRAAEAIRDAGIYKIRVLEILNEQQVSALKTQFGESGLLHVLGGPGRGWKGGGFGFGRGLHR